MSGRAVGSILMDIDFESLFGNHGIVGRVVNAIRSIIIDQIAMRVEDVQNTLYRASDIEVHNGSPGGTFLIQRVWAIHELKLLLYCGLPRFGLTEQEELMEEGYDRKERNTRGETYADILFRLFIVFLVVFELFIDDIRHTFRVCFPLESSSA